MFRESFLSSGSGISSKMSSEFNPLLWFVCRRCRQAFPDTDKLKKHKIRKHSEDCTNIKCIIFEERLLDTQWIPMDNIYPEAKPHTLHENEIEILPEKNNNNCNCNCHFAASTSVSTSVQTETDSSSVQTETETENVPTKLTEPKSKPKPKPNPYVLLKRITTKDLNIILNRNASITVNELTSIDVGSLSSRKKRRNNCLRDESDSSFSKKRNKTGGAFPVAEKAGSTDVEAAVPISDSTAHNSTSDLTNEAQEIDSGEFIVASVLKNPDGTIKAVFESTSNPDGITSMPPAQALQCEELNSEKNVVANTAVDVNDTSNSAFNSIEMSIPVSPTSYFYDDETVPKPASPIVVELENTEDIRITDVVENSSRQSQFGVKSTSNASGINSKVTEVVEIEDDDDEDVGIRIISIKSHPHLFEDPEDETLHRWSLPVRKSCFVPSSETPDTRNSNSNSVGITSQQRKKNLPKSNNVPSRPTMIPEIEKAATTSENCQFNSSNVTRSRRNVERVNYSENHTCASCFKGFSSASSLKWHETMCEIRRSEYSDYSRNQTDKNTENVRVVTIPDSNSNSSRTVEDFLGINGNDDNYSAPAPIGPQKKKKKNTALPKWQTGKTHDRTLSAGEVLKLYMQQQAIQEQPFRNLIRINPDPTLMCQNKLLKFSVSSENPVTCKLCEAKFTNDYKLRNHVENCWFHNKDRHVYCTICEESFSTPLSSHFLSRQEYLHHMIKKHPQNGSNVSTDQGPVNQVNLGEGSSTKDGDLDVPLGQWLQKIQEEKPSNIIRLEPNLGPQFKTVGLTQPFLTPIKCKLCEKLLSSDMDVRNHVTACYSNNKDEHVYCVPCERTFSDPYVLRCHTHRLHWTKSMTCQQCQKAFTSEFAFRQHNESLQVFKATNIHASEPEW